ncbi:hypothetical protein RM553_09365 [Zunongwangia sp. F363]|uniref:UDP-glycosyltransferase n=1 Tax=Autumnicola tepida TaxID=3075595 RepID=A0ABU3C9P0_9FLAO|nr:hypothetical protein [Zunongwangia sp. F363]MDT0643034.1 hypothetical protein [Zunongwangia sp. F363]
MSQNSYDKPSKVLGLVIVDGVGFKNFVLSDFLNQATGGFDRIIIYSGLPASAFDVETNVSLEIVELTVFIESRTAWFWRKMKEVAHLQQHKKNFFGIAANLDKNRPKEISKRAKLISLIFKITSICNSEKWIDFYNKRQINAISKNPVHSGYKKMLSDHNCDLLFFTHQRPPYLAVLDDAAKKLGIKTCSFIFSWDNLPSKGRMAAPFDSFLVWSDLMKEELHYFYPETKNKPVKVVGTPQFEPYVMNQYHSTKKEFSERFNIKQNLKTICYSCGDISTSQNDGLYIETIATSILYKEIPEVNLIVRTSPAENGSRFSEIKEKFPFIIWNFPQWELTREDHPEPWSQRVPFGQDVKDLRSLLEFCDLNINMCSTMSLDFMIFDKPVINPVFGNAENRIYNDQKYLQYAHYERVVKSGAVSIVKNKKELIESIKFSLENPQARIDQQRALLKLQIGKPLEGTSYRIVQALKEIS